MFLTPEEEDAAAPQLHHGSPSRVPHAPRASSAVVVAGAKCATQVCVCVCVCAVMLCICDPCGVVWCCCVGVCGVGHHAQQARPTSCPATASTWQSGRGGRPAAHFVTIEKDAGHGKYRGMNPPTPTHPFTIVFPTQLDPSPNDTHHTRTHTCPCAATARRRAAPKTRCGKSQSSVHILPSLNGRELQQRCFLDPRQHHSFKPKKGRGRTPLLPSLAWYEAPPSLATSNLPVCGFAFRSEPPLAHHPWSQPEYAVAADKSAVCLMHAPRAFPVVADTDTVIGGVLLSCSGIARAFS
jgi:hypothetical protein